VNQGRILVIDDDPQIRRVLRTTLVLEGYEVADARSGQEAIEARAIVARGRTRRGGGGLRRRRPCGRRCELGGGSGGACEERDGRDQKSGLDHRGSGGEGRRGFA